MNARDDVKRLRIRDTTLDNDLKRSESDLAWGTPCLLARTTSLSAYPTKPESYFACQPLTVLGSEVEGSQALISVNTGVLFALNLGSTLPPVGIQILLTFVSDRWVFHYDA